MTIQDLGSIGEFVAAVATMATLLYLALQIRQNSQVVRTSNYWQLSAQFSEFSQILAEDETLMDIYQRGIADFNSLTELEQGRFHMVVSNLFTKYQLMAQLSAGGMIDADMHQEQFEGIAQLCKLPGIRQWWATAQQWYGPTFREFMAREYMGDGA